MDKMREKNLWEIIKIGLQDISMCKNSIETIKTTNIAQSLFEYREYNIFHSIKGTCDY